MTKRVYRYFFDYIEGQQAWLNTMAAQGWRLVKCGQLAYDFESCTPGEYEYAVEFVAHKAYAKSKDYKAFLEEMGYQTHYKNVNVGIYLGKVQWRPWGEDGGQITTAPGSYQNELIIVEKKRDGKPFALHTDLSDSLAIHSKTRDASFVSAVGMLLLTVMLFCFSFWTKSILLAVVGLLCGGLGYLCAIPGIKASRKVRRLKEEGAIMEHEPPARNRVIKIVALVSCKNIIFTI